MASADVPIGPARMTCQVIVHTTSFDRSPQPSWRAVAGASETLGAGDPSGDAPDPGLLSLRTWFRSVHRRLPGCRGSVPGSLGQYNHLQKKRRASGPRRYSDGDRPGRGAGREVLARRPVRRGPDRAGPEGTLSGHAPSQGGQHDLALTTYRSTSAAVTMVGLILRFCRSPGSGSAVLSELSPPCGVSWNVAGTQSQSGHRANLGTGFKFSAAGELGQ